MSHGFPDDANLVITFHLIGCIHLATAPYTLLYCPILLTCAQIYKLSQFSQPLSEAELVANISVLETR